MFGDAQERAMGWRRVREYQEEEEIIERYWGPKSQLRVNPHRAEW